MRLIDIFKNTNNHDIISVLKEQFPFLRRSEMKFYTLLSNIDDKENIPDVDDWMIFIRKVDDDFNGRFYTKVSGINGTMMNGNKKSIEQLKVEDVNHFMTYSLMDCYIVKMLGMKIFNYNNLDISDAEIAAHCLFEMSYFGFDDEEKDERLREIKK